MAIRKPRLLDLFCGAGGAAMGYHRAGFEVVGVDIKDQPHYPFLFMEADALEVLGNLEWFFLQGPFDAIHASPPCQRWIRSSRIFRKDFPDLITPTRPLLKAAGIPWVLENVPGAPLRRDYQLCGGMFMLSAGGRNLYRHRWFEVSWGEAAWIQAQPPHPWHTLPALGVYGHPRGNAKWGGGTFAEQKQAMGIDWMTSDELSQAIPPVYTEFIGNALLARLEVAA